MVTRRDVVLGGLALSSVPLVGSASIQAAPVRIEPGAPRYFKVIYDERFAASVDYARRARARGESVHGIQGDMTDVWYHDIDPAWRRGPVAIAGVTAHGPLFCLERLSWDFGLRLTRREALPDGLFAWEISPRPRA